MNPPRPSLSPRYTEIYQADHLGDLDALGTLVGGSFADLNAVHWLLGPDQATRSIKFGRWAEIYLKDAIHRGQVDVIDDEREVPVACAVWFTDPHAGPPPEDYDRRLRRAVGDQHLVRFGGLGDVMTAAHPHTPHEYLLFLAVSPDHQNGGLGSELLRHRHRLLDQAGAPAYLEAASPDSVRLYQRHGYQPLGEPLTLPADVAPSLWPMWREPRPYRSDPAAPKP